MRIQSFVYLTILCCFSSIAIAQNSKFSGPYAQFGVGYQTASPSFSNTSLSAAGQSLTPTVSVSNASGFTGTVGSDQSVDLPRCDIQMHIIQGEQAAKLFADVFYANAHVKRPCE
mgnify:CR=1 FL=1